MNIKSIRWRLPLSYAAIALLAALSLGSVMLLVLNSYYARQERDYLLGNAQAIQPIVETLLKNTASQSASLQDTVNGLAFLSQTRIRVLDEQGNTAVDTGIPDFSQLVALSGVPAGTFMLNISGSSAIDTTTGVIQGGTVTGNTPPDDVVIGGALPPAGENTIISVSASPYGYALSTTTASASARRSSQTVALALSGSLGTLEISDGPAYGWEIVHSVSLAWAGASGIAILLAALAGWFVSRQVTHPVLALTSATQRMESGDLTARVGLTDKNPAAEFRALAHSFNDMAHQVEGTVSTLRAFVADAAHELHTPLTALHTNLELAADETNASHRTLYLQRAQEQSARLEELVSGLLDLSRIEAGQPGAETSPLDLGSLLSEMEEHFASRAEQVERTFSLSLPAEPLLVSGSPARLRQVVTNLFENSLKFTPSGGSISITLVRAEGDAVLMVTDTGIGVPPEDLPHLFERFHRGRNASCYPGSGLGLAITRALVAAHGGSIQAESGPGQGMKMTVRIPVTSSDPQVHPTPNGSRGS